MFGGGNSAAAVDTAATNQATSAATAPVGNTAGTTYQGAAIPGQGGGWQGGMGLALGGLQTVGSLWNAYQQQKIAKESLSFQKEAFNTNLKNSTQTYNTALEDRIRARHYTEGKSDNDTSSYLKEHSL